MYNMLINTRTQKIVNITQKGKKVNGQTTSLLFLTFFQTKRLSRCSTRLNSQKPGVYSPRATFEMDILTKGLFIQNRKIAKISREVKKLSISNCCKSDIFFILKKQLREKFMLIAWTTCIHGTQCPQKSLIKILKLLREKYLIRAVGGLGWTGQIGTDTC